MPNRLPIPLKEMTPEQRRKYNNEAVERARERKRLGLARPRRDKRVTSQAIGSLIAAGAPPETLGQKNIYLSIENALRIENTIKGLAGPPLFLDQTSFFDGAVRTYLEALEEVHNDGQPFPTAPKKRRPRLKTEPKPKRGRPRKSKAAQV